MLLLRSARALQHIARPALRRSAAHGLLEIQASVPSTMVKAEHAAEMGALAARLVERRWRDKEWGDAAEKVEALAKAHGHVVSREAEAEEPEADSGDM